MALAAVCAGSVVTMELRRNCYNRNIACSIILAASVGGLIGARLLYIMEEWSNFIRSPLDFALSGAGFSWYGGMVGGTLAVTWVVWRERIPWLKAADICAPAAAVAYGVGRLGCHIAGDGDWGIVTNVPWAVAYTNAIIGWVHPYTGVPYPPGVKVHPTAVYEAIQSVAVFALLWPLRKKSHADGTVFWLYLTLAGLMRFVVEFWRINLPVGLGMTEAQWFSLISALLGALLLYRQKVQSCPTNDKGVGH